ncbi:MAG: hypothetical protein ACI8S3_001361, partial [Alphaproteobacteria bacterium]
MLFGQPIGVAADRICKKHQNLVCGHHDGYRLLNLEKLGWRGVPSWYA